MEDLRRVEISSDIGVISSASVLETIAFIEK